MKVPSKESISEFINGVDSESCKSILTNKCKFLFIDKDLLYFVMYASDEEKAVLRDNWSTIKTKAITSLNVKNLKPVLESEEKALFLEKALEVMQAKEVKISLA